MEVIIKGEPKEIAALVFATQERHEPKSKPPMSGAQAIAQQRICEVRETEDKDEVARLLSTGEWVELDSVKKVVRLFLLGRIRE